MPFDKGWVVADINVGILYLFAMSSLGVYGIIMAGWASNSKYPFLSALRAAAQMVSYEVSIGFVIITVLLFAGSLNLSDIVRGAGNDRHLALLHWNCSPSCFPCCRSSSSRRWRRPTARPSTWWKRNPNWWRASSWNIPPPRSCCSSWANISPSC